MHPCHTLFRDGLYAGIPVFPQDLAGQFLLACDDVIYPAFATHNAYTIGAIKAIAGGKDFEFQIFKIDLAYKLRIVDNFDDQ